MAESVYKVIELVGTMSLPVVAPLDELDPLSFVEPPPPLHPRPRGRKHGTPAIPYGWRTSP